MNDLKRLGLAGMQPELERHLDWLVQGARDIELQDLCESVKLLEGDWPALARRQAALLSAHRGRVGVHAPFWNMHLGTCWLRRASAYTPTCLPCWTCGGNESAGHGVA